MFALMKPLLAAAFLGLFVPAMAQKKSRTTVPPTASRPAWVAKGNVYEVNIRQYTPEGTFNAFAKHLPRLKKMGVQTLWLMPVNPISVKDRKGELGSYYASSDYKAINPEFGNMTDFKNLVNQIHALKMKVIIDWVANHTGADHYWLTTNLDFYEKNEKGEALSAFDWTDTRSLDFSNKKMADSMIYQMAFWLKNTGIDGFRCDVAGEVPDEFWKKAIPQLRKIKPIFMLAEGDKPELHTDGFDASYPWEFFAMTKELAMGKVAATRIDTVLNKYHNTYKKDFLKLWFTSNHDENSWNKADYGTMPGEIHAPFALLTQTLPHGMPLIYSGQEEPYLDSISFFYKDSIRFANYARAPFYTTLLRLKQDNDAFAPDAIFKRLYTSADTQLYAFEKMKNGRKMLVLFNFSNVPAKGWSWKQAPSKGNYQFIMGTEAAAGSSFTLPAWGYALWVQ